MLGRKERSQLELFISGSLRQLIPDDHVLVRVERVLDLSWLRDEVADCYCLEDGRPGIDPEAAVRLMLAGLLSGIVHDRRLMREAQVNLAIRWFAGYALHEKLPDHSSLTRIRQRWGPERFKAVLSRTVKACIAARIATGEVVHLDATLIRANVSWDAIVEAHADAVLTELDSTPAPSPEVATTSKTQRICQTDPDASLGKGGRLPRVEPAYKQQTAVDTKQGVILDVEVTTGAQRRTVLLNKDHPAQLRARRRHLAWTERERILYASHRARVEGVHGEEKAWHGLARAVRRGLANMKIQAYLTAAAVNLKRLAAAVAALLLMLLPIHRQSRSCTAA